MERLGFGWEQVHDIAEQLEHVDSVELVERLDAYLGHPQTDPHGDPIPKSDGTFHPEGDVVPLAALNHASRAGERRSGRERRDLGGDERQGHLLGSVLTPHDIGLPLRPG